MHAALLRVSALRLPLPGRQHWPSSLVLATLLALYLVAGFSVTSIETNDGRAHARAVARLPSLPELKQQLPARGPMEIDTSISRQDAVAINAKVPLSTLPNPAARPFRFAATSDFDRLRAVDCLTAAVYYEAAVEGAEGQRAVAQVVLNRVRHPAYPSTVCGVVFEGSERATGCQFTFTCDGAMRRAPIPALWQQARTIAEEALAGKVYKPVGHSTHYHTNWVVPYWSASLEKVANVGTHIFYRWGNGWGTPPIFRSRHAGSEPEIALMRPLSSVPMTAEAEADPAAAEAQLADASAAPEGAVERRYEPMRQEAAAAVLATQVRPGAGVPSTHNWALTGQTTGPVEAALGRKLAAAPAPAPETCAPAKKTQFGPPGGYGPTC